MKMLKLVSLFAVVCILMVCVAGSAFAAGSKSDWVEIKGPADVVITDPLPNDPVLTATLAAAEVDGAAARQCVKLDQWNITCPKLPVTLTFIVDLAANQKGFVYHWNGSDWDLMGNVNEPIVFDHLSPVGVAIFQYGTEPTPTPAPDDDKPTSPATGSNGLALALAAIVMGGTAAFIAKKKS